MLAGIWVLLQHFGIRRPGFRIYVLDLALEVLEGVGSRISVLDLGGVSTLNPRP